MRYDEIRLVLQNHFSKLLAARKNQIGADGPLSEAEKQLLRTSADVGRMAIDANGPLLVDECETDDLLMRFIARYDLSARKGSVSYAHLSRELNKAYRDYALNLLAYNDTLQTYNFDAPQSRTLEDLSVEIVVTIEHVTQAYFNEAKTAEQWAEKTQIEKTDHIELLLEIIGKDTDIRSIGPDKSREVKSVLLKYPKNRNKNPATRGRSLIEVMSVSDMQTLNPQTINKYLQTYSTMFGWAKRQGYVQENNFEKLTIRNNKRASINRDSFNENQIKLIIENLTSPDRKIVRKAYQKWGPLIGLFTGARLNEIAQIHLSDIKQSDGIWYFDLNDAGEDKKLKTDASRRLVPIHDNLLSLGLLDYVNELRAQRATKLFPDFTYCPKNGWGRSLGRWFNDVFLPDLGIKAPNLVFHSLRHTVTNNLMQASVPEPLVQALIGHTRANMLNRHYFSSGYKLKQLSDALHKLPY